MDHELQSVEEPDGLLFSDVPETEQIALGASRQLLEIWGRGDRPLSATRRRRVLEELPESERRVLKLRFGLDGQPRTLAAIGEELGVSRDRIREIEQQALDRLAPSDALGSLD